MDIEQRLDQLERKIHQLKVDYNRFFAGDLLQPPEDLRASIDDEMRRLRALNLRRLAERYRLGSLEAQLNSYGEMYQRRLRAVEEGKVPPRHPAAAAPPRYDVDQGVLVGARPAPAAVEALFQELCARSPRGTTMDLDTFRGYLERQVAQIRQKTGCQSVQFRLVAEEGKVKLKAKPVATAGAGPT